MTNMNSIHQIINDCAPLTALNLSNFNKIKFPFHDPIMLMDFQNCLVVFQAKLMLGSPSLCLHYYKCKLVLDCFFESKSYKLLTLTFHSEYHVPTYSFRYLLAVLWVYNVSMHSSGCLKLWNFNFSCENNTCDVRCYS
jgi:hypothetical protein